MADQTLTKEQLICLTSPIRHSAFKHLATYGPASARELGQVLGRSTETMNYHMRTMLRSGLIQEAFRRPAPKRPEVVYQLACSHLSLPNPQTQPELSSLTDKVVLAGMRATMRGYREATQSGEALSQVIRMNVRLSPKALRTLESRLADIEAFLQSQRDLDGIPIEWTSIWFGSSQR